MTVIQSKHYPFSPEGTGCSICNEQALPPFVYYTAGGADADDLIICSKCIDIALVLLAAAERGGSGLLADVIQLRAIRDLGDIYPGRTFKRVEVSEVEARDKQEAARLDELCRGPSRRKGQ